MGALAIIRNTEFKTIECGECGIVFAVEGWLKDHWADQKHGFFCPNGHSLIFAGETEVDRLKKELAKSKRTSDWNRDRAASAINRAAVAERKASAARGQVTRMRRRVGHGVCPCCNRTFQQLARHMVTKHPDFAAPQEERA